MKEDALRIRPHHGLCILNFEGHGYSDAFSVHMAETVEHLRQHPETKIILTKDCDELCSVCPHREAEHCTSKKPPIFDRNVLEETGFAAGEELTWAQFSERTGPLSLHALERTCPGCEWLSLCREIAGRREKAAENSKIA